MKQSLKVLALILALVACSDFWPKKKSDSSAPAAPRKPLPDQALLDEQACVYGDLESHDTRQQFLWTLATKSVCPRVRTFRYHMTLLRLAGKQVCLDKDSPAAERELTHNWYGAISSFEYLIANPMEPLRANSGRLGMEIYSWPNANKFALNGEMLKAAEKDEAYTMNLASTRKGFTAIEKLIFNKEAILSPGPTGTLRPEEAAFNALTREKRRRARCVVLSRMMDDAAAHTEELYSEWDAGQKQYPRQMLQRLKAGAGPMILNEVSDGLFYLEKVKDSKLAVPLGLNARCRKDFCPEEIENVISGASVEALRSNFEAFRAGIVGVDGPGFLALVREVGRPDLAQTMQGLVEAMDKSLFDIEQGGDFTQQVLSVDKAVCTDAHSPSAVCRLYYQYKAFSTLYRSDFMTTLNLNPPRTEADND